MKKLIDLIQEELVKAFTAAEMDPSYARVSVPTARICANTSATARWQPQKTYKKEPIDIANGVVEQLKRQRSI